MITPFLKAMPLDIVKNAVAAYSFRKLKATAVKAIRVQRSSDNTELDIGFIGTRLDTVSMLAFVGANIGYITTWYDQSGSGNNAVQTDNTKMPRIINAGTMDVDSNGNPIAYFDGSNDWLNCGFNGLNAPNEVSISAIVADRNVGAAEHQIVSCTETGGWALHSTTSGFTTLPSFFIHYNLGYNTFKSTTAISNNQTNALCGTFGKDTNVKLFHNGTKMADQATGYPINAPTSGTNMAIGANPNAAGANVFYPVNVIEVIRFNRELTEIEVQKLQRNQGKYYNFAVS